MVEEIAITILGLALKLFPEIETLLAREHAAGNLPPHIAAALAQAMPTPGASAQAVREIASMP